MDPLNQRKFAFNYDRLRDALLKSYSNLLFSTVMRVHEISEFSELVKASTTLKVLKLDGCFKRTTHRTDLEDVFSPIECVGGDDGAKHIADALRVNTSLTELHLEATYIGAAGAAVLADALKVNLSIYFLVLSDNDIGDEGAASLADALVVNKSIKGMCVYRNGITATGCLSLCRAIRENPRISWFRFKRNKIGVVGAEAFGKALRKNRCMETLNLSHCEIKDKGMVCISRGLKQNKTLAVLKLTGNDIGVVGAIAIAAFLKVNPTLEHLKLCSNRIGNVGVETIAAALHTNKTITVLGLADNKITDRGAQVLAECLAKNSALIGLELSENSIGDAGAQRLARVLAIKNSLDELDLQACDIGNDGARSFIEALKTNTGLSYLNLGINPVDNSLREQIDAKLTTNLETFSKQHAEVEKGEDSIGWSRCKISILGDVLSGKTCLVRGLLGRRFNPKYSPTVDQRTSSITLSYNRNWRLSEADTFRNRHFAKIYFTSRGMQLPPKYRERIGMSIVEYGSRCIDHSIHQLLLSSYGINVYVFDMEKMLNNPERAKRRMSYSMQLLNLRANVATVLVIGTRLDIVSEQKHIAELDGTVKECTQAKGLRLVSRGNLSFFPVDNKVAKGISQVQQAIGETVVGTDHGNVSIPVRWISCLEKIKICSSSLLPVAKVEEICQEFSMSSGEEISRMLSFFHDAGELLYLSTTENLASFVATKPSALLDPIAKIVDRATVEKVDFAAIQAAGLRKEFMQLKNKAIVSRDLLHYFWKKKHANFLLDVMLHLFQLSPLALGEHDQLFLVPSMIPSAKDTAMRSVHGLRAEFRYAFLPNGIFERMICLFIDHCSHDDGLEEPVIRRGFCRVHFNNDTVVEFEKHDDSIVLAVFDSRKAQKCLSATLSILRQINEFALKGKLSFALFVEHEKEMIPARRAKRTRDCVWFQSSRGRVPASVRMSMFLS